MKSDTRTAVVLGGGIIGCASAIELAKRGYQVTVIEKGRLMAEASSAAAGMLGAHAETHQPGPMFELCLASQRLYRDWVSELESLGGRTLQYRDEGILRVARTEEEESELRSRLPWVGPVQWLEPEEARTFEPELGEEIRGGLYFRQDHQIHPVLLAQAFEQALKRLGCTILEETAALSLIEDQGRVSGVRTSQGPLQADVTVLAAGAWSGELLRTIGRELPLFPVKGQCYSLKPAGPVIHRTVFAKGCYLVPRSDGTITVGATQQEAGFDRRPTVNDLYELHRTASVLLPVLRDAELVSTWAGLRPGTPDGLPYLGMLPDTEGLIIASGHYRNGILLAPATGLLVGQLADRETPFINLDPFAPARAATTIRQTPT